MAVNTLTEVIPRLLAQGLLALRQNCVMPSMVNNDYSTMAAEKGAAINVPIPSAVTAVPVTHAVTAPEPGSSVPTSAVITLDQWYEAAFFLSDKDLAEAISGVIPMQASEAIKALGNNVDSAIMTLYKKIYGFAGSPGTTPFSVSTVEATEARKVLNNQLAPLDSRRFVIDPDAEANALGLRAFQDMSFSGSAEGIREGKINRKLGFDWFMDQNAPRHTTGSQNGAYTTNNAGYALGVKTVTTITGAGTIAIGDQFTIAGDSQVYVATALMAAAGALAFEPGLKVVIPAAATAITVKGTASTIYAQNLAFHRDCFAFASRPLADNTDGLGNLIQAAVDPVSGLTLRLEIVREHKRTRFSYDILYGCQCVRPELGVRLWGDNL